MINFYNDEKLELWNGDCVEFMRSLPENSIDAVVCDPPYSLGFMGKTWDSFTEALDPRFGDWLAGFVDGEGCFRLHVERNGNYYACHFQIKLRRDDRTILDKIKAYIGVGYVKNVDPEKGSKSKPCAIYLVDSRDGCTRIRDIFNRFPLRAKKARDFAVWSIALDCWINQERGNRWIGPSDKSAMKSAWLKMKSTREYVDPPWSGNAFQDWSREWASEAFRVLKPGGHLLAFGGSRTYHRLACAVEDAGFEIRDQIMWVYGCLSEDTELLIDGKWMPYHRATKGSLTLCYNLATDDYEWQPIQEVFVYDYADTAFRIQSDYTDQIVSRNHRCIIEHGGKFILQAAETLESEVRVPILEDMRGLLQAVPVPNTGADSSEQDLYGGVQECTTKVAAEEATTPLWKMDNVSSMPDREMGFTVETKESKSSDMLTAMQRCAPRSRVEKARLQGSCGVDTEVEGIIYAEDVRVEQSGVERRCDVFSETRELQTDKVRPMSAGVSVDGPERRICDGTSTDCSEVDRQMSAAPGSSSSRQSQSTRQSTDESGAICDEQGSQTVRASRFAITDLARVTPIFYEGKVWCVRVPTGCFIARRNGKVFITGNSGFPKSLDVSKAFDKAAGDEWNLTAPVTGAAKQWFGFGTALKPAHEPIVVARKPLIGTVVANIEKYGTGAINIDGCRVSTGDDLNGGAYGRNGLSRRQDLPGIDRTDTEAGMFAPGKSVNESFVQPEGRWPANLIHDGSVEVLECFPLAKGQIAKARTDGMPQNNSVYGGLNHITKQPEPRLDSGSAARFFYCAKSSKSDRGEGNNHSTVKPIALMCYLVRLVTPPNGTVLDPFSGSGTTLIAAHREGFRCIGTDKSEEYCNIALNRIINEITS